MQFQADVARRAGDRPRDRRDDRARSGLSGGNRRPDSGIARRWRGCGARRRGTSPGWPKASASDLLGRWQRRWSGPGAGRGPRRRNRARARRVGVDRSRLAALPLRMADIKPQVYKDPRPAADFDRYHDWTRTHKPGWTYELSRMVLTPIAIGPYRCRAIGTEHVPADGPVILAPNHFSNMDHFFAGVYIRRKIQFLAKSQLFGKNRVSDLHLPGRWRVPDPSRPPRRGGLRHRPLDPRPGRLRADLRRGRALAQRRAGPAAPGRRPAGAGVRACRWFRSRSTAPPGVRKWRKLRFPKVTVQYAEPLRFDAVATPTREQQQEASERIFEPVRQMYEALDREGRRGVIKSLREGAAGAVAGASPRTPSRAERLLVALGEGAARSPGRGPGRSPPAGTGGRTGAAPGASGGTCAGRPGAAATGASVELAHGCRSRHRRSPGRDRASRQTTAWCPALWPGR